MKMRLNSGMAQDWRISHDWDCYRQFLVLLDRQLDEAVQEWEKDIDQKAEGIEDPEIVDEFYESWSEDYFVIHRHKTILMNSFFTASFALYEHHLTMLCNHVQKRRCIPFSMSDLKNSFSDRAKTYLTRLEIPFPNDIPEWKEIKFYQEVRNKIVHEGGTISKQWQHLFHAVEKGIVNTTTGVVSVDAELQQLELTRAFCDSAIDDFKRFLKQVNRSIAAAFAKPTLNSVI